MTGKTPGQLGIYGFRNRKDTSYDGLSIATADAVKEPAVWDAFGGKGLRSLLIGVPPSYPPPKEFPGLAGRLLPHAAVGEVVGVPRRARDRADHGARLGVRDDRQDARASSGSTGSATARTPPTTGCRSRTPAR